mmetsp:Transcript_24928/g.25146  ORF Transcript_24928/g.25146 Transcript_24928/m.25146 type:complete len:100 (+) Transcript_24928:155-454(+)
MAIRLSHRDAHLPYRVLHLYQRGFDRLLRLHSFGNPGLMRRYSSGPNRGIIAKAAAGGPFQLRLFMSSDIGSDIIIDSIVKSKVETCASLEEENKSKYA